MIVDLLREIDSTVQHEGEARRRWFTAADMDLFVWQDPGGELVGFQLAYDKPHREKAIYWRAGEALHHASVLVDGPAAGGHPGSALMVTDRAPDGWHVCGKLLRRGRNLDEQFRNAICRQILAVFASR